MTNSVEEDEHCWNDGMQMIAGRQIAFSSMRDVEFMRQAKSASTSMPVNYEGMMRQQPLTFCSYLAWLQNLAEEPMWTFACASHEQL